MGYHYNIKQTGEGLPDSPAGIGEGNFNVLPKTKTVCYAKKKAATNRPSNQYKRILTMISTAYDLDIDQQQREQQATIAEELFISGEGDGYDGIRPNRLEWAYLYGYAQGQKHYMAYIQEQADLLESEGLELEAKVLEVFGEEIPF